MKKYRILSILLSVALFFSSVDMTLYVHAQEGDTGGGTETVTTTPEPTAEPTVEPTQEPTVEPTTEPTEEPTAEPTQEPTAEPTATIAPTETPEVSATAEPTQIPVTTAMPEHTAEPGGEGEISASATPTLTPSVSPTGSPTVSPSVSPSPTGTSTPLSSPSPTTTATPSVTPTPTGDKGELKVAYADSEGVYQWGSFVMDEAGNGRPQLFSFDLYSTEPTVEEYIYQALINRETTIDIYSYGIQISNVNNLVSGIINENPDLYYVLFYGYSYYSDGTVASIKPTYGTGLDDDAFHNAVDDALAIVDDDMSDLEKAIAFHEYLALNCEYDLNLYTDAGAADTSYSAYGVFVEKVAVCQGYALAFKYLCNQVGIDCHMVTSVGMNHAWNMIELDGELYQVDVTWDDPVYYDSASGSNYNMFGCVGHDHMFISDAQMGVKDHYAWEVTVGSEVVELEATDTSYDEYFWTEHRYQLVPVEGDYYYTDYSSTGVIMKYDPDTSTSTQIAELGRWNAWGNPNGYWSGAYAGIYKIGDRLYYNTSTQIQSVALDGTDKKTEYVPDTSNGYVYASLFYQGNVEYMIAQSPNSLASGTVYTVSVSDFSGEDYTVPVSSITLNYDEVTIKKGNRTTLTASIKPSYATDATVTWSSSDTDVATVVNGTITAVGQGTCIITASAGDKSATCVVNVTEVLEAPAFVPQEGTYVRGNSTVTIDRDATVALTAKAGASIYYTTDGSTPTVGGSSTKLYMEPIAINQDMTIKAKSVMTGYEDSAVSSEKYVACDNELALSKASVVLMEGKNTTISVSKLPTGKWLSDVSWTSSDEAIATYSNGYIYAASGNDGQATITATTTDHKGNVVTAECTVTVNPIQYRVTFTNDKGVIIEVQMVKARRDAVLPESPEKEGYEFSEWSGNYQNITKNETVKAVFTPKVYSITYVLNGGVSEGETNPATYTIESPKITLQDAVGQTGTVFAGWFKTGESKEVTAIEQGSVGDITLNAKWQLLAPEYSVAAGNVDKGTVLNLSSPKSDAKIYYTLDGSDPVVGAENCYLYESAITLDADIAQNNMIELKAIAVLDEFEDSEISTAAYKIYGCDLQLTEDMEASTGDEIELSSLIATLPDGTDSADIVWDSSDTEAVSVSDGKLRVLKMTEDIVIVTAKTQDYKGREVSDTIRITIIPKTFKVTFVDWDESVLKEVDVQEGKTAQWTDEAPIRAGYDFAGWLGIDQMIVSDSTLKAEYTLHEYAINYVLGETGDNDKSNPLTYTVESGEIVLKDAGNDPGYFFDGWYKDAAYTQPIATIVTAESYEDITLYAKWTGVDAYPDDDFSENLILYIKEIQNYEYTGKAIKPAVEVYVGDNDGDTTNDKRLELGTDYTVTYKNNIKVNDDFASSKVPTVIVSGKGNYSGKAQATFLILPKGIDGEDVAVADVTIQRPLWAAKPDVKLSVNNRTLKKGRDYELSYWQNGQELESVQEVGDYQIKITGIGNYTGSREVNLTITEAELINKVSVSRIGNQTYTGNSIEPAVSVRDGLRSLTKGTDYSVRYENNVLPGNATIVITGMGNYAGEKRVTFKITGVSIGKATVSGLQDSFEYTGEEVRQTGYMLTLADDDVSGILTEGSDFTVSYQNNIEAGTASIIFTGIGGYTGTLRKTFKINKVEIEGNTDAIIINGDNGEENFSASSLINNQNTYEVEYEKGGSKPVPTITIQKDGESEPVTLTAGKDYVIKYRNNGSTGNKATMIIQGKGSFSGIIKIPFLIKQKEMTVKDENDISGIEISAPDKVYRDVQNNYLITPTLTDSNGKKLKAGVDYEKEVVYTYLEDTEVTVDGATVVRNAGDTVQEGDKLSVGTVVKVAVRGKGNYSGTIESTYKIVEKDIKFAMAYIPIQTYSGKEVEISKEDIIVRMGGRILDSTEYEIVEGSYKSNNKVGFASVTIKGSSDDGSVGGTKTVRFFIKPAKFIWWWKRQ